MCTLELLQKYLEGAPIDMMLQDDPNLLFEDIQEGLVQLRDLWPAELVSPQALSDSEPKHLVLAVRALSSGGPPQSF